MTLHLHHLWGSTPAPLAHYLKGLGVLRIVAEQKDPEARGYFQDEHFCLMTTLDRPALEAFFLDEYAPAAFVSPWNRGSGFYNPTDRALIPMEQSLAPRFAPFRAGIAASRGPLADIAAADAAVRAIKDRGKAKASLSAAEKRAATEYKNSPEFKVELAAAERHFKKLKAELYEPYLRTWRGPHRAWLDAALVWIEDEERAVWPSLLGTGGSDGRLDFTNNAMQRLGELFALDSPLGAPLPAARSLLEQALWGEHARGLSGAPIGQFLPGSAGGPNSSTGLESGNLVNPWDFVLMLEGALLFSARSTRRLDPRATAQASAPFAVRAHAAGYGTRGKEKTVRGEQWMPLWAQPATVDAVASMFGEARLQLGRTVANRPIDVARAIARLGTARGVTEFVRFGYLERNGQSNIAVPLGRVSVQARPRARLIDDLARWLQQLNRLAGDANAPARFGQAEGVISDAVFSALTHDDSPERWQAILFAATGVETIQAAGTGTAAGPIPPLSPEWLRACDDGSVEWRLACALGSAAAEYRRRDGRPQDPVRHHWLPLQPGARRFLQQDKSLMRVPRVVVTGRDPVADLGAIVERRLIEAAQRGGRRLPLVAARGVAAAPSDLAELVAGRVDLERVSALGRALMALRWDELRDNHLPSRPRGGRSVDEAWIALRLASLPWPLPDGRSITPDNAMVRRLIADDGAGAVDIALRRLHAAGLRPPLRVAYADPATSRLWAAALAFPINPRTARTMARRFESSTTQETR